VMSFSSNIGSEALEDSGSFANRAARAASPTAPPTDRIW
jgi:hypothetical protein